LRLVVPLILIAVLSAPAASAYPTQRTDRAEVRPSSLTAVSRSAPAIELYAYLTPSTDTSVAGSGSRLSDGYDLKGWLALRSYPPGANPGVLLPSVGPPMVRSTVDMLNGNPPLQAAFTTYDPRDLSPYGLFSGYFEAFSFRVNPGQRVNRNDPAARTGGARRPAAQARSYFAAYQIDITHLSSNYQVNFDLYSEKVKSADTENPEIPEIIVGPFKKQDPPIRQR
jgi:hypothetical protein